jgi:uncharacterized membrane protein YgcG
MFAVPSPSSSCCSTSILLALHQPMLRSSCSSAWLLLLLLPVNADVWCCRSSQSPPLGSLLFSIHMHLCPPPQTVQLYLSSGHGLRSRSHAVHNPYRKTLFAMITCSNRRTIPYFGLVHVGDSDSSVEGGVGGGDRSGGHAGGGTRRISDGGGGGA